MKDTSSNREELREKFLKEFTFTNGKWGSDYSPKEITDYWLNILDSTLEAYREEVKRLKVHDCSNNSSIFNHDRYFKVEDVLSVLTDKE